jgi:long-chain acyl-CoA synthetase
MQYWKDPEATAASVKNGWFYTGDVGELDYGKLDDDGNPTLRIIDRVANMTELYINGDSVWVEQARLEAEVYANAAAADRICLLSDRNQPCLIAIVVPNKEFILKSAEALKIPLLSPRVSELTT